MAKNNDRIEVKIVTPRGGAIYPKLNKPDTKFVKEGVYESKLKFSPDATDGVIGKKTATWAEIKETVDANQAKFLEEKKAELMKGDGKAKNKAKTITSVEWGVEPDVNDEGEETGDIVIKAKMKASGVSAKSGENWTRKPKLFDARGKVLAADKQIWGGSELKIAGTVAPYYNAKDNVVGSTMYLEAVQVLELVSGQGREAGDFGFGEEEGYTDDVETPFADEGGSDGGDGNF